MLALISILSCGETPVTPQPGSNSSWSLIATGEDIVDVSGSSSNDVYALGLVGSLFHYDGTQWTASVVLPTNVLWSALWCASPNDIFLAAYAHGERGSIYHFDGTVLTLQVDDLPGRIRDIWGSARDNVYVVGDNGAILHYDGISWETVDSGTSEGIREIWGLPTGELFTVLYHEYGIVRNEVMYNNGSSWKTLLSSRHGILDVWASSLQNMYVIDDDQVLRYDGENWTAVLTGVEQAKIWGSVEGDVYVKDQHSVWHFDGNSWQESTSMPDTYYGEIWGSGKDVFVAGIGEDDGGPHILHYDWDAGQSDDAPYFLPYTMCLTAISGNGEDLYVGGGHYYAILLRYEGSSWHQLDTKGLVITDIDAGFGRSFVAASEDPPYVFNQQHGQSVYLPSIPRGVWAPDSSVAFIVGDDGMTARYDGSSIEDPGRVTASNLHDIWGHSSSEVYAVGDGGTILSYDGESWHTMGSGTTEDLQAVWGDAENTFAVGARGTILQYKNSKWMPMHSSTTATLTGVWGGSDRDVFAVGQNVTLHYDGSRWEVLSDAIGGRQVWGRSSDEVYVVDGLRVLRYGNTY